MKYLKYKKMNEVMRLTKKEYIASCSKDEQRKIKRRIFWTKNIRFVGMLIFFSVFFIFLYFITRIPQPKNTFLSILFGITCFFFVLLDILVCCFVIGLPFGYMVDKISYSFPNLTKEYRAILSNDMKKFYGLNDTYLITKCFFSTDKKFNNHDICIFKVGNEIRITTNIVYGFLHNHCELGCYSISFDELKLYKDDYNNKRVAVLKFGKEKFVIGIKAYAYINNLLSQKVYKHLKKRIEFHGDAVHFIKRNVRIILYFKDIESGKIDIFPIEDKNTYTFEVKVKNKKTYTFQINMEKNVEKEMLALFRDKGVILEVEYKDNKEGIYDR